MWNSSDDDALLSLLSILRTKEPESPIASVVNTTTIDLISKLLSKEYWVYIADRIRNEDVGLFVDFLLDLLRDRDLSNLELTTIETNRRARRLIIKIISSNPIVPQSLILTGVKVPAEREYIGRGGFGGVCKGEFLGEVVALKILFKGGANDAFNREALTWAMLRHKFVLPFLGIYAQRNEIFLVSPYMENGTLAQWRKDKNPSTLEIGERILEVAQGMEFIHSERIVHGDLRGANILLDANLHVRIADFGLTRLMDATNTRSGNMHNHFAAPELFGCFEDPENPSADGQARTQESDVYAFGCLYYEIHYDNMPFPHLEGFQIMAFLLQNKRPPRLEKPSLSDEAWDTIQRCWERDPNKRPNMKTVTESIIAICRSMPLTINPQNNERTATSSRIVNSTLQSLLSILNDETGSSIESAVNTTTLGLLWKLLSKEDYVDIAEGLTQTSDARNLLDFILYLHRNGRLPNQDPTVNITQRARRLMIKVVSNIPVIPPSMIVTGISFPFKHELIGGGGFGDAFKGNPWSTVIALKYLRKANRDNVAFCREALMQTFLKHKFVLPFLGIYQDRTKLCSFLVLPYMRNGTLSQWRKQANPSITEIEKRMLEVAQGLAYIHSEGMVHGNIRGANVLLDDNLHVQIADFGLTRLSTATNTGSGALHIHFAAPELFGFSDADDGDWPRPGDGDALPRTQMSDVYGFGCLYYEIHYNSLPFAGSTTIQIVRLVSQGARPPRLDNPPMSDGAWDMMQRCWTKNPSHRPGMKNVVEDLISLYFY